jgi:hypothetical protein
MVLPALLRVLMHWGWTLKPSGLHREKSLDHA